MCVSCRLDTTRLSDQPSGRTGLRLGRPSWEPAEPGKASRSRGAHSLSPIRAPILPLAVCSRWTMESIPHGFGPPPSGPASSGMLTVENCTLEPPAVVPMASMAS